MSAYAHYFASSPARLRMEAAGLFAQKAAADAEAKRIEEQKRNHRSLLDSESVQKSKLLAFRKEQWQAAAKGSRPSTIMAQVIKEHGFSTERWALEKRRRYETHVNCRQEMFYRLRKETNLSLPEIGRRVGGFDHSTVFWGIRSHQKKMNSELYVVSPRDPQAVISEVLAHYEMSENKWGALHRDRSLAMLHCRQHVCYRLFHETRMSLRDIGNLLGGYADSTLKAGMRQHKKRLDEKAPA